MKAKLKDYNIEFKCSLMLSGVKLELLPVIYNLPVQKLVGDLDYNKIRHSKTELSEKELKYGEYDCLVVYHYIKKEIEIMLVKIEKDTQNEIHILEKSYEEQKDFEERKLVRVVVSEILDELFESDAVKIDQNELVNLIIKKVG